MRRTYLLSGGPHVLQLGERPSRVLGRRPGRLAAERDGEVPELVAEARGEERREAALQPERRRMLAGEQRREVQPAEREHRRGLGHAHAHRVPPAVEQRDLADASPRAGPPDLHRAIPGHVAARPRRRRRR